MKAALSNLAFNLQTRSNSNLIAKTLTNEVSYLALKLLLQSIFLPELPRLIVSFNSSPPRAVLLHALFVFPPFVTGKAVSHYFQLHLYCHLCCGDDCQGNMSFLLFLRSTFFTFFSVLSSRLSIVLFSFSSCLDLVSHPLLFSVICSLPHISILLLVLSLVFLLFIICLHSSCLFYPLMSSSPPLAPVHVLISYLVCSSHTLYLFIFSPFIFSSSSSISPAVILAFHPFFLPSSLSMSFFLTTTV